MRAAWAALPLQARLGLGAVVLAILLGALAAWRAQEARIAEAGERERTAKLAYENQERKVRTLEQKLVEANRRRFTTTTTKPDGTTTTTTSEYEDSRTTTLTETRVETKVVFMPAPAPWTAAAIAGGGWLGGPEPSLAVGGAVRLLGRKPALAAWALIVGHYDRGAKLDGGLAGLACTF